MEPKMQSCCYYSQGGYYLFIYIYVYVCEAVRESRWLSFLSVCVGAQVVRVSVPPLAVCLFPPLCDVSWGLSCCDEAALITGSRRVCGSRSVIIEQPGGRAEITQHISSAMRLPDLQPRPSRCSNGCRICLNTGIKLGWRKRRNNAVTDGRREKKWRKRWHLSYLVLFGHGETENSASQTLQGFVAKTSWANRLHCWIDWTGIDWFCINRYSREHKKS